MNLSKQNIYKFVKENRTPILVFIGIAIISHLDGNVAMFTGVGFEIYGLVLLLAILARLVSLLIKRTPEKKERLKKTGIRFIYVAVLSALSLQGIIFVHHRLDTSLQPLIEKLETYKTEHGKYPDSTFEITNQSVGDNVRNTDESSANSLGYPFCDYFHYKKDDRYCIVCMTFGLNHHSYCSNNPHWSNWD